LEEEKIVRIREKDYNHLIDVAKGLKDYINSSDKNKNNYLAVTYDFPTVYFLKKSKISLKLKKYLPYLIYYKDIFESDLDGVTEMKEYLEELFRSWVEIIPDEYYKSLEKGTVTSWENNKLEKRASWFSDLMLCYGFDEFNEFVSELKYYPFMRYYGIQKKTFNTKEFPPSLISDLKEIWKFVQQI